MSLASKQKQFRCTRCSKLLANKRSLFGYEIKCARCGTLNTIFEDLEEQITVTNSKGVILFINARTEVATGYCLDEAIGRKATGLWRDLPAGFLEEKTLTMRDTKVPIELNVTNRKKTGEPYTSQLYVSPVLDSKGEILFLIGVERITA